jgi:menaquinone-dependent protoporphyrinogen oxidase
MKTAIIYASKHGTTEKVAVSIAEKLKESNEVELFSIKKNANPDISDFGTVILGSSIYAGKASGKMKSFCAKNEQALLRKKIGLFVCGMEPSRAKRQKELVDAYPEVLSKSAVATGFLGGEFKFEEMNFFERFIIKRISKTNESVSRIDEHAMGVFIEKLLE